MKKAMKEIVLLKYKDVLERIQDQENHLLLGNGFNHGLGVNTSYHNIFQKMMENDHGLYKNVEKLVQESGYDLESFIGKLINDIDSNNTFLKKFVNNKIKLDFMKATHEIVQSAIKNVYAEKNEGIFLLFNKFTNYFTLNYDSFLYLLLLKFKSIKNNEENAIVFQPSLKFIEDDMNERENNIYTEIKDARKNGKLIIDVGNDLNSTMSPFNSLTKTHFITEIKEYSKSNNKGWKNRDIVKVVNVILEEEKKNNILENIDDGFRQLKLFDEESNYYRINANTQNLFFLHGAFHIYKDGKQERKITQRSDKALYERLEDVLNSEERDIVCVFQSDNKKGAINESKYLNNCLNKLKSISGKMVIIGCSLSDNDKHIFEQINNSGIKILYISTLAAGKEVMYKKAKKIFSSKSFFLFDAKSISYELPDKNEKE